MPKKYSSFLAKIGNGLIASLFYSLRFFCDPCLFSVLTLITFGNRRVNELRSAKNTSFFLHLNVLLELKVIICFLIIVLSLKNSLRTRKSSQIPFGQLFPPISGDTSFELSLRYRLYDAWFHGTFKWWLEKLLALDLR